MTVLKSRRVPTLVAVALMCFPCAQPVAAQQPDLETLWNDLAGADAEKAYRAVRALASTPGKSVPFLKEHVKPVSGNRGQIDKLVRDLDSAAFPVRDKALVELERLGDVAEESLKQALTENPGLELRRRIELLLARIPDLLQSPGQLRLERALEALELASTPDARDLIEHLADGNPAARFTRAAKAASARLVARAKAVEVQEKKTDAYGDPVPAGAVARLGTTRLQGAHWATVAPDGKTIVAASAKSLNAWDTESGRPLPGFPQERDWPDCRAVALSPDGKLLAVAYDRAYSFDVCEFPSGKLISRQRGSGDIFEPCHYTVAFSSDSKNLMTVNQLATGIFDVRTGKKLREIEHPRGFFHAVFSADGRRLVLAARSDRIYVWDVGNGEEVHAFGDQKAHVFQVAVSRDGSKLATYGAGPSVRIWDAVAGKMIREIPLAGDPVHGDPVPSFAFSPDGAKLGVVDCIRKGEPEQRLQIWNMGNLEGKPLAVTPPPGIGRLEAFMPDGKSLLWRIDGSLCVLDAATGKDRHGWASRGGMWAIDWSSDGKRIATVAGDTTAAIWDARDARPLHKLTGHRRPIGRAMFSPDGKLLVTCGGDKEPAILWDASKAAKVAELENNAKRLPGVLWAGFSADSKWVYTAGYSVFHGAFETQSGKLHSEFKISRNSTWSVAFSPDGRYAASGIDGTVIYDMAAKKVLRHVKSDQTVAHAFSADTRTLAVLNNGGKDRDIVLHEVATGRERARFVLPKTYQPSGRLRFSPDGRFLAAVTTWYNVESLHALDLIKGEKLGPFPGHLDHVADVAFSPDSRYMATASHDGTVLIRKLP